MQDRASGAGVVKETFKSPARQDVKSISPTGQCFFLQHCNYLVTSRQHEAKLLILRPVCPVEGAVLDGFCDVARCNIWRSLQVGNRPRELENPVMRTGA